ncbi:MAG TPA: helix-turn-helix transcriptional regulator [Candidatus Angelobacter sp.]
MSESRFRERLETEFRARREKNPRYSLRAFAAFLGVDHSTLSQILRGVRRPPVRAVRAWGRKLGMGPEEVAVYIAAGHLADPSSSERMEQLRHWTAEAMAVISDRAHWRILEFSRMPGFTPDCRRIAAELSLSVDEINLALGRLLRLRLLELNQPGKWKALIGPGTGEPEFRKLALKRVQQMAAEDHVRFVGGR